MISELYGLYQGTPASSPVADRLWRAPGSIQLKSKIVPYLLKSVAACNVWPSCLQVAFDCIFSEETTAKLENLGMMFVQWLAKMMEQKKLEQVAPVLLSGLLKFINSDEVTDETIRGFAYEGVGLLAKRVDGIFKNDAEVLQLFFDALAGESKNVKVSVQNALVMLSGAFVGSEIETEVKGILKSAVAKSDSSRYAFTSN